MLSRISRLSNGRRPAEQRAHPLAACAGACLHFPQIAGCTRWRFRRISRLVFGQFFRRILGATAVAVAACGCRGSSEPPAAASWTLVASGDTAGWIVPCGCSSGQSGGLLRRASLVSTLAAEGRRVIVCDVGGAAAGVSPYHRLKLESILRGELAMGLAAHNLGASELAFGPAVLREIRATLGVPFVSANTRDREGKPLCPPSVLCRSNVTSSNGSAEVLIIGVVDPQFATQDIEIADPAEAVLQVLSQLPAANRPSVVVLAWAPQDQLFPLANQLPEVDVVIGGPTGQSIAPRRQGATVVCSATNKGKFVVRLDRSTGATGWSGAIVEVDPSFGDDAQQSANLDDFRRRLRAADFAAETTMVGNFNTSGISGEHRYAGNASCAGCHPPDSEHWVTTKHAVAWASLQPRESFADPYCQQCHTTGYAQPGGFQTLAASHPLVQVGCESCHGPSSQHVVEPARRTPYQSRDQCVVCHDRENSPQFAFDPYWAKIVHGVKAAADVANDGEARR